MSWRFPLTSRTRAITRPLMSTNPRRAIVTLADPPAEGIVTEAAPAFRMTRPDRVSGEVAWIRVVPSGTFVNVNVPFPADLADEMSLTGGPASQISTAASARGAPISSTTVPVTVPRVEAPGKRRPIYAFMMARMLFGDGGWNACMVDVASQTAPLSS